MNQSYTADLDISKYQAAQTKMVASAKAAATDLDGVYAKMAARAAKLGPDSELGTRSSGLSARVFGGARGGPAPADPAAAADGVAAALGKVAVVGYATKKAWNYATEAVREYAKVNDQTAEDLAKIDGTLANFKKGIGRDISSGFTGVANDIAKVAGWIGRAREVAVDFIADTRGLQLSLLDGEQRGYGNSAAARDAQKQLEELKLKKVAAEKTNDLQKQFEISSLRARANAGEEVGLDLAKIEAAQRLAAARQQINAIENITSDQRAKLLAMAQAESDAVVASAKAESEKRRAEAVEAERKKRAEEEAASRQARADLARENDALRFDTMQTKADAARAQGLDAEADAMARRAEYELRIYQILASSASMDVKRAATDAAKLKYLAEEKQAREDLSDAVKDTATASLLAARQASTFDKAGAELAGRKLAQEKQLEELRRRGASDEQLRMVGLAQSSELSALALEMAREGFKPIDAAKAGQGEGRFYSQIAGPADQFAKQEAKLAQRQKELLAKMDGIVRAIDRNTAVTEATGVGAATYGP